MLYNKIEYSYVIRYILVEDYDIAKLPNLPNCKSIFYSVQNVDIAQSIDVF